MKDPYATPDLSLEFPSLDERLKIKPDLERSTHGPHFDIIQAIPSGIDKFRISPSGDFLGGSTQFVGPDKPHEW